MKFSTQLTNSQAAVGQQIPMPISTGGTIITPLGAAGVQFLLRIENITQTFATPAPGADRSELFSLQAQLTLRDSVGAEKLRVNFSGAYSYTSGGGQQDAYQVVSEAWSTTPQVGVASESNGFSRIPSQPAKAYSTDRGYQFVDVASAIRRDLTLTCFSPAYFIVVKPGDYYVLDSVNFSTNSPHSSTATYFSSSRVCDTPIPSFTAITDEDTVNVNGSASTINDDPGNSIASYQWVFGDSSTGAGAITSHAYEESESYNIDLTVYDQHGSFATTRRGVTTESDQRSDSLTDEHGSLFTAANVAANQSTQTGTGVQVTRHEINNAGQYTASHIQAIYDIKNPTLLQQRGTHGLYVFAQNRTTKVWQLWHSDDYGEAFVKMADSPLNGDYKSVVPCSIDGGLMVPGIKKGTAEIWFVRSWDGIEYDAIEGGTGTGQKLKLVGTKTSAKTVSITSEEAAGVNRIVAVVDGTPFKFSDDFGDSWENAQ